MANWFVQAFGGIADAIGNGIADVRDKLVFEAWFGRPTPDRQGDDPGWSRDHPGASEHDEGSVLDMFYDRLSPAERAEHFCEPPEQYQGIER